MLTISEWDFAVAAFPVYILVMSTALFALVRFPHVRPSLATAQS